MVVGARPPALVAGGWLLPSCFLFAHQLLLLWLVSWLAGEDHTAAAAPEMMIKYLTVQYIFSHHYAYFEVLILCIVIISLVY